MRMSEVFEKASVSLILADYAVADQLGKLQMVGGGLQREAGRRGAVAASGEGGGDHGRGPGGGGRDRIYRRSEEDPGSLAAATVCSL